MEQVYSYNPGARTGVHISFDHNTKFGCCVHAMCVQAGGPEILRDAGAPPPWDGGVANPVDILLTHGHF